MRTRLPITPEEIVAALNACKGDMRDAAEMLGISERTLYRRMADFGIKAKVSYETAAA